MKIEEILIKIRDLMQSERIIEKGKWIAGIGRED